MSERTLLVRVSGRVQGVGFRAFTSDEAGRRGIAGWVRNRGDGSVEAALLGPGAVLGELLARLREGPPTAEVARLDVQSVGRDVVADVPDDGVRF